jgi:hypothetical protein
LLLAKTPLGQQIEEAEKLLRRLETLEASEDLVSMILNVYFFDMAIKKNKLECFALPVLSGWAIFCR